MQYLEKVGGSAVESAWRAFECFEPYGEDEQEYARATLWLPSTCEEEVVKMLHQVRERVREYKGDGREAHFDAEQNALVAKNAEKYYRTMVRGDASSWNVRDRHMAETLDRLVDYHGPQAKAIVWAHNTHIGDARATDMADSDMVNVGQLVREDHAADGVVLVGFSSHRGMVIAGDEWGAPMHPIPVPAGREGSWEDVLHRASASNKLLLLDHVSEGSPLQQGRGHRAIGVVYRPQYEQYGNYVPTVLPRRYDALLYLDQSRALHPISLAEGTTDEVPETYPSGV
jgi:erythromycin esterase-like protein